MFLPHRDQFNFDICIVTMEARLMYPASHPQAIHPSLINAIGLAACSCAGPDLKVYEAIFLKRAQLECERALANVDRLEHFLWASVLIVSAYLCNIFHCYEMNN